MSENSDSSQSTVSISLTVKDAAAALEFYTRAFGASELYCLDAPDGTIGHCEFMLGNTRLFLSGESPDWKASAMPEGTMASCLFTIETDGCDAAFKKAVEAGAESLVEPQDYFWGMRSCVVKDPYGYRWSLAEVTEDVSPEELARRAKELFGG